MTIKVYNTLHRKKEEFVPKKDKKVGIYVCGLTPYDYAHLGHAKTYVAFDVIMRYLEYRGYDVFYVQNVTDVEDKLINRAKEIDKNPLEIADQFFKESLKDFDTLNIKRADLYPLVSEHIEDIVKFISELIEKGYAYESDGNVYFSIETFEDYGKLSNQSIEDILSGARISLDERKRNPVDFALWKKAKKDEIFWDSPWGKGRPGWHIECSVMSTKYIGVPLDIHGGAIELAFPHHENEIAQSEARYNEQFVTYWLHTGVLTVEGEKMSKSLGNFTTIKDLLKTYNPLAVRLFLASIHYRSRADFSEESVESAKKSLGRIHNAWRKIEDVLKNPGDGDNNFGDVVKKSRKDFEAAMDDDFNTPKGLAAYFDLIKEINKSADSASKNQLLKAKKLFEDIGNVFGILRERKEEGLEEDLIQLIIDIRENAREKKDFEIADTIRARLREIGIVLEDGEKTRWKKKL
ncbi:MAG: cysteine--tRNA ligase [Euryarchaeota archaeon]|nr:cysteine--tRNA ligase [Euryarchaeota archaeon]